VTLLLVLLLVLLLLLLLMMTMMTTMVILCLLQLSAYCLSLFLECVALVSRLASKQTQMAPAIANIF